MSRNNKIAMGLTVFLIILYMMYGRRTSYLDVQPPPAPGNQPFYFLPDLTKMCDTSKGYVANPSNPKLCEKTSA